MASTFIENNKKKTSGFSFHNRHSCTRIKINGSELTKNGK